MKVRAIRIQQQQLFHDQSLSPHTALLIDSNNNLRHTTSHFKSSTARRSETSQIDSAREAHIAIKPISMVNRMKMIGKSHHIERKFCISKL